MAFNVLPSPFQPLSVSAAPAALIPVAGVELFKGLLIALGLGSATVGGGFALSEAYPYVYETFYNLGSDISDWFNAIPEDTYYTDGAGVFYLGNSTAYPITDPTQLVLKGNAILDSYSLPLNVRGNAVGRKNLSMLGGIIDLERIWKAYPNGAYMIPWSQIEGSGDFAGTVGFSHTASMITTDSYTYINFDDPYAIPHTLALNYTPVTHPVLWGFVSYNLGSSDDGCIYFDYGYRSDYNVTNSVVVPNNRDGILTLPSSSAFNYKTSPFYTASGSVNEDFSSSHVKVPYDMVICGALLCDDVPEMGFVNLNKDKLDDVIISVGGSPLPPAEPDDPEDPDNDPDNFPNYLPPSYWEVFTSLTDLLNKSSTNNTNNNTTLNNYIQNNYTYNVVINDNKPFPSDFNVRFDGSLDLKVDANVSLGGDITINVNIDDKTELPSISEGDGENFFGADFLDVFAGLTKNNPVIPVLSSLFGVVDPSLVSVFSVTLSLSFLLALWRLLKR